MTDLTKLDVQTYISPSSEILVAYLPLNDGSKYELQVTDMDLWRNIYTHVDIDYELKKMLLWLIASPSKRKTRRGMKKFVNGWLSRTNDKALKENGNTKTKSALDRLKDRSWSEGLLGPNGT